jgi:regulator of RNase E activity RraB
MGLLSRWRDREPVSLDDRSPQTGLKHKDLLVLDQLVKAGADMTAPRHVLYFLYLPDQERAAAAAAEAESKGFEAGVREPLSEYPDQWSLVCERHDYVLDLETVRVNTDAFEELAARHGGDYDGWEASVA